MSSCTEEEEYDGRSRLENGENVLREGLRRSFICELGEYWVGVDDRQEVWEAEMKLVGLCLATLCAGIAAGKVEIVRTTHVALQEEEFEEQILNLWKEDYLQRNAICREFTSLCESLSSYWDRLSVQTHRYNMTDRWVAEQQAYCAALLASRKARKDSFGTQLLKLNDQNSRGSQTPPLEQQIQQQQQQQSHHQQTSKRRSSTVDTQDQVFEIRERNRVRRVSLHRRRIQTDSSRSTSQGVMHSSSYPPKGQGTIPSRPEGTSTRPRSVCRVGGECDTLVITSVVGNNNHNQNNPFRLMPLYIPHKPQQPLIMPHCRNQHSG
eukprot:TRINITY_DN8887_c0_g2_i1.p1 TRINITY_DN8887_c0_g2~~TRINITY_DN8887_c0_g2_i1.p1  ORF type:complete len:351 (+),score=35.32 TRINITY_DN8887_c0_g2_i1:88-1053(+)